MGQICGPGGLKPPSGDEDQAFRDMQMRGVGADANLELIVV